MLRYHAIIFTAFSMKIFKIKLYIQKPYLLTCSFEHFGFFKRPFTDVSTPCGVGSGGGGGVVVVGGGDGVVVVVVVVGVGVGVGVHFV